MKNISKSKVWVSLLIALFLGVFFVSLVKADNVALPTGCGPNPTVTDTSSFDSTFLPFGFYQPADAAAPSSLTLVAEARAIHASHALEVYIIGWDVTTCTSHVLDRGLGSHGYSATFFPAGDGLAHIYSVVIVNKNTYQVLRDGTDITSSSPDIGAMTADFSSYGGGISVVFDTDSGSDGALTPAFQIKGVNQNIDLTTGITQSQQCNTGNAVSDSLCKAAAFVLIPSDDATNGFHNTMITAQNKIPFSYFYDFITAFNGQTNADTNSFPTLSFTFFGHSVTMLSYDTVEQFTGSTNLSLMKGIMIGGMYLGLGFYFYERIKHLIKS